jgi:threonine synthase
MGVEPLLESGYDHSIIHADHHYSERFRMPQLTCIVCHHPPAPLDWRCTNCGSPLEIADMPPFDAARIDQAIWSLWRYQAMLPVDAPRFTLGEGMTPLNSTSFDGIPFYAKLDYLNPTGSYKDRGAAVLLNYLAINGAKEVVEVSSGNAGSAVAQYSGGLGLKARIFTPAAAPGGKKRQIRTAAELIDIPGPRSAVDDACMEALKEPGVAFATHSWNPYFIAGQMTGAWELWEQLGRRVPQAVACPVGMGCLLLGLYKGFLALRDAGLIERLPRILAVQAAASDPIVQAIESGLNDVPTIQTQPTAADGIVIAKPVRSRQVLAAIRDSGGWAFRVSESDILPTRDRMARQGLLVEPTSATTVAALPQFREVYDGDDLVVVLTGNGLKTLDVVAQNVVA